jgi:hypothetical protein
MSYFLLLAAEDDDGPDEERDQGYAQQDNFHKGND